MTKEQILQIQHDLLCGCDFYGIEEAEAVQTVHWIAGVVDMTRKLLNRLEDT